MAATNARVLDTLPPAVQQKFIDLCLAKTPSRKIREYLATKGVTVSHHTIARYQRSELTKALDTARKIAQAQGVTGSLAEQGMAVANATRDVVRASPVLARVNELWSEWREGTDGAKSEGDWKAHSSYVRAGAHLAELEGKASGDPNFAPQQQANVTNILNLAMVMPPEAAEQFHGETLDIKAEPTK
jgi:hypothetical protein